MKKLLSIILTAAMLFALCPVVFAADADTTEFTGYTYVFTEEAFPNSITRDSDGYVPIDQLKQMEFTTPGLSGAEKASDPWKAASSHYITGLAARPCSGLTSSSYEGLSISMNARDSSPTLAIAIKVEKGGTYLPSLKYFPTPNGIVADVFLVSENTVLNNINVSDCLEKGIGTSNHCQNIRDYADAIKDADIETNEANGIYILQRNFDVRTDTYVHGVTVENSFQNKEVVLEGNKTYFLIIRKRAPVVGNDDDYTQQMCLDSFSLTPVQDEELTSAFTIAETPANDYVKSTVIGIKKDGTSISAEPNEDGSYDITAPETGNKFLYWALGLTGNKRIVSFDETLTNYVPAQEGRNYLIAVYEGDVAADKKEFYNQNGQLIPDATENTSVSMPGYGSTSKWEKYGDTNIYVAQYDKATDDRSEVTVTVVNGTGGGTVLFGDTVTCTADETKGTFKCWTKSNIYGATEEAPEIVSVNPTYTFKAWEDCTVTAVYEDHHYTGNKMKIIIDTFTAGNETGVMAEFVGLDNAVEKGIMFTDSEENTTKIAMTTKDNQFTVIADAAGTYEGYAIVKEGDTSYTLITDGKYE